MRIGVSVLVAAMVAVALPLLAAAGSARSDSVPSPATALVALTCPSASQCTAANQIGGEVTFNPTAPRRIWRHQVDTHGVAISCPSTTLCAAVADNQVSRRARAWQPKSGRVLRHWRLEHTLPVSVACGSSSQCTATGASGREVTFDPKTGKLISNARVAPGTQGLTSVSCPAAHQCSAIFGPGWPGGEVVTFDPIAGTSANPQGSLLSLQEFFSLSCPSTTQCTAVGEIGQELTFDPQTAQLNSAGVVYLADEELHGVSCPSVDQCTAVDGRRHEQTFDPTTGTVNAAGVEVTGTGKNGQTVDCPAVTQCTVVGGNGKEATFNPESPGAIVAHSLRP